MAKKKRSFGSLLGDALKEAATLGHASTSLDRQPAATTDSAGDMLRSGAMPPSAIPHAVAQAPGLATLAPQAMVVPVAPVRPPSAVSQAIEQALASIPMPDPVAYSAPFDQASSRVQTSLQDALTRLPAIYEDLRSQLAQHQAEHAAEAQQQQQNMAASQASTRNLVQQLSAPVLADLQKQGGNAAVGSLTGSEQAQMATALAALAQQGGAQTQLSQNLANAEQQSMNSRVDSSRLAETASQANARNTANTLLGQIDVQRAQAQQQYAKDLSAAQQQQLQYQLQLAQLADQNADPAKQLQTLQARDALNKYQANPTGLTPVSYLVGKYGDTNPVSTAWLTDAYQGNKGDLDAVLLSINAAQDKNGKIKYQGKKLDAATLKRWVGEAKRYSG